MYINCFQYEKLKKVKGKKWITPTAIFWKTGNVSITAKQYAQYDHNPFQPLICGHKGKIKLN